MKAGEYPAPADECGGLIRIGPGWNDGAAFEDGGSRKAADPAAAFPIARQQPSRLPYRHHDPVHPSPADDLRLRAFRHSGFAALFSSRDPLCRFWFQDLRRLALFLALMRDTQWLRGDDAGRFLLATLAGQAQMSVARASQVLATCASTGDFRRRWDDRDARHLVFDPSPAARAAMAQLVAEGCKATAAFLGQPDPLPQLDPLELRRVHNAFIEHGLVCLADVNLADRSLGSLTFLVSLLDLALHSPLVTADFIRREAARLRVTTVTLRNVLNRAERGGWIHRSGRMLSMPPEACERVWRAFNAAMAHAGAVLEEAEAALARQRRVAGAAASAGHN